MSSTIESPTFSEVRQDTPSPRGAGQLTVALAGNPNAGKTSLFNALTGLRQKVANYPGVTVERKEGIWSLPPELGEGRVRLIDLPGLYSLDAASIDERIARDILLGRVAGVPAPNVILAVVDTTNLERNLYLVTQLLETGLPVVVALSMIDLAERRKFAIDAARLSAALKAPVVPVVAKERRGLDALARAIVKVAGARGPGAGWRLSEEAERELSALADMNNGQSNGMATTHDDHTKRYRALLELYGEELTAEETARQPEIEQARARLADHNSAWWQEPLLARYGWIERIAAGVVRRDVAGDAKARANATERIDRVVTHRFFGPVILLLVMLLVFQAIFTWAQLPMDVIDAGFGTLGEFVNAQMPPGLLTDLLVDGVIAGVGGVLIFLPQILLLFFFISLLEDSGYMARAAFLMDRLMRGAGLHGKAFMPLMSSFACAIPGIMATRTIENPKDRLATIMIAPLMSCSARLPVYTLMIAAFFTGQKFFGVLSVGVVVIMAMYLLGILVAVAVAWVLKHTILKAPPPPLVLELPPYRLPNLLNVAQQMKASAWMFIRRAGTVILAISILLWVLVTFPRVETAPAGASNTTQVEQIANDESEQLRQSYAGRAGRLLEPLIEPLGLDWKTGIGLISSFAARETLVSTMSIVYNSGDEADENSASLIDAIRTAQRPDGSPAWTPLVAVSMMVFFVLACQCMSTVAVVRRETNSWRWPLFMVAYMLALAYVASFITYQGGRWLGFS
ncbi:ferrous iron transport protein B [soil metagenome]